MMSTPGSVLVVGRGSPTSDVDGVAEPGNPVAGHPFATGRGVAWSGTAAARRGQSESVDHATVVGVRPAATSRPGCAGLWFTPGGPGNGCARRGAPSRPA